MFRKAVLTAVALAMMISSAFAADLKPAIIYDMGGKFDKSFNEAAYNGVQMFNKETGIKYRDFEPTNESQYEQAMRRLASRGSDIIIVVGFSFASPLEKIAPDFPDTKFVIIDSVVDLPNVQSVVFKEHEGSFLVGMLAAMKSETGKVGFVGGMDIPLIRNFAWGYEQGVKYVNEKAEVIQNMTGTTPAAWTDPIKGGELARSQYDRGADIIFAAAGRTGLGVLQAAKDTGRLAIGVDSNQNHIQPGSVLTSMVKRVDVAVYDALMAAKDGTWEGGVRSLGLAENGVDYALDEHNKDLISADMKTKVDAAREMIVKGELNVTSYYETQNK